MSKSDNSHVKHKPLSVTFDLTLPKMQLPLELMIETMKYLPLEKVISIDWNIALLSSSTQSWSRAAETGSDLALYFLHKNKIPLPCSPCLLETTIAAGHMPVLNYLLTNQLVTVTNECFHLVGKAQNNGLEMAQLMVAHAPLVFGRFLGMDVSNIKTISIEIVPAAEQHQLDGNRYFDFGGFQLFGSNLEFVDDNFSDTDSFMSVEQNYDLEAYATPTSMNSDNEVEF